MSPALTSQGLVLATVMAVSAGTVILFDLFRQNLFPSTSETHQHRRPNQKQVLKSCLSPGRDRREGESKKKKRVRFADDVKDSEGNGELYRKQHRKSVEIQKTCGNSQKMPANHVVLYSGILKDRVQRMGCSY